MATDADECLLVLSLFKDCAALLGTKEHLQVRILEDLPFTIGDGGFRSSFREVVQVRLPDRRQLIVAIIVNCLHKVAGPVKLMVMMTC